LSKHHKQAFATAGTQVPAACIYHRMSRSSQGKGDKKVAILPIFLTNQK